MLRRIAIAMTLCCAAPPIACAADYTIDPTFAPNEIVPGWLRMYIGTSDEKGVAFARTPDGGYVVCLSVPGGGGAQIVLVRLDKNGEPVAGFGSGAGYRLKDAYLGSVADMTIDAQGRIIVVGATPGPGGLKDFGVVRFNPDGSDDTSFAGDGGTSVGFDDAFFQWDDDPMSVLAEPNGKIVIAGTSSQDQGGYKDVSVVRLNSDGSRDGSFGNVFDGVSAMMGTLTTFFSDEFAFTAKIVRLADGHYVVVGTTTVSDTDTDFAARILTPDGEPFADDFGSVRLAIDEPGPGGSLYDSATTAAVDRQGRIVVAGNASGKIAAVRVIVAPNHNLGFDNDFVGSSIPGRPRRFVGIYPGSSASGVGVRSDGRIVIVGDYHAADDVECGQIQRLNADGSEDPSFAPSDPHGAVVSRAPLSYDGTVSSFYTTFRSVLFDAGRMVLMGSGVDSDTTVSDFDGVITRRQSDLIFADGFQ